MGIVKRYESLGLTTENGQKAQNEVLILDYVKPVTLDGFKLLDLTARGKIALGKMGIKVSHDGGRGGLEHRFYLDKLKRHFIEKGYFTYLEKDNIDLIAEKGEEVVAVQVETGKSDTKRNIQSLIGHRAHRKVVVATNKQAELRAREIKNSLGDYKIEICFVRDFHSILQ